MKLRKIVIVTAVAGLSLATGGWLLQHEAAPAGTVYQQARLFEDVLAHVADYYVDSIDERRLYQLAIDGMLDQVHDPYSVFLKRDDFKALNEATAGIYGGLGIQIEVRDGWITVVAPLPDTPAERAGIQTGDQIVGLDGRSTEGWKQDQAVKELRGEAGSPVELKVRRVGIEQPITFKLTRAQIHVRSVQVSMLLDDKVGYVLLTPVSETSAPDLTDAVTGLLQKGMKSLILDLRGNPGGLLDQGVAVSRSEEHTSELQSQSNLVCRLLLEKKKYTPSCPIESCWTTCIWRAGSLAGFLCQSILCTRITKSGTFWQMPSRRRS